MYVFSVTRLKRELKRVYICKTTREDFWAAYGARSLSFYLRVQKLIRKVILNNKFCFCVWVYISLFCFSFPRSVFILRRRVREKKVVAEIEYMYTKKDYLSKKKIKVAEYVL